MKLSAKTGVALTITALSLVVTVGAGAGASDSAYHVEEGRLVHLRQLPAYAAHVDMMNQLRNLTEANAIKWGWSQGLANDRASAGMTQYSGS